MTDEESSVLDFRETAVAEQLAAVDGLMARTTGGESLTILTSDDVVAKFILPAAAGAGLRCRVLPVAEGGWRLQLAPGSPSTIEDDRGKDAS